jgi:hypothetical protein
MTRAPFNVVADRGIVKAYKVKNTPTHGAMPRLVLETNMKGAHERYRDKVTDQAGSFPELHIEDQLVLLEKGDSWVVSKGANHTYKVIETFSAVEATSPPAEVHGRDE